MHYVVLRMCQLHSPRSNAAIFPTRHAPSDLDKKNQARHWHLLDSFFPQTYHLYVQIFTCCMAVPGTLSVFLGIGLREPCSQIGAGALRSRCCRATLTGIHAQAQIPISAPEVTHRTHPVACRPPYESESNIQCGVIEVPLDYHNESAGNGQIYYARLPADEGVRKGTIFVDPGMEASSLQTYKLLTFSGLPMQGSRSRTGKT